MVRLVFRPYSHVGRTICTSVSLQASTRVSPGFTKRTNRSPSFGSHHECSDSNRFLKKETHRSAVPPPSRRKRGSRLSLSFRARVYKSLTLAYVLDSLVRVSRRVERNHFVERLQGAWGSRNGRNRGEHVATRRRRATRVVEPPRTPVSPRGRAPFRPRTGSVAEFGS